MGAVGWTLRGRIMIACNCDYGCPCNFNALPTQGYCHGQWTWAVEEGSYGDVGGPWGILAWTWPTIDGPYAVPYDVEADGIHFRVRAGEFLDLGSEEIKNPVTGAAVHPGAVLPEGIVTKRADFGSSTRFRVSNGFEYEYAGRYTATGPFEYSGS